MTGTRNLKMWLTMCCLMLVVVSAATADTHYVAPPQSIQAAINAAVSGDQIEVAPGTYNEAINFNGKAIRLYSTGGPAVTTIDATGLVSSVVTCNTGEGATTIMEGFTITGGNGVRGGGMYNLYSSPTVTNCIFSSNMCIGGGGGMSNYGGTNPTVTNCNFINNRAGDGGGMMNVGSTPTVTNCNFIGNTGYTGGGMNNYGSNSIVTNCTFISNTSGGRGAGMMNIRSSNPTVTNCKFSENWVVYTGGGMSNEENCNPIVTNCTFSGNTAAGYGSTAGAGAGMCNGGSNPTVTNCILWNDTPNEIYNYDITPTVTYSDVQQGYVGTGNIDADPMFTDALNGDYRLLSGSPCIDAGNNAAPGLAGITTDLAGVPRFADDPATADTGSRPSARAQANASRIRRSWSGQSACSQRASVAVSMARQAVPSLVSATTLVNVVAALVQLKLAGTLPLFHGPKGFVVHS
jgi:hypothetical protein